MAEVVSPTVARRRVRLALREARETAELTQQQVAEEMEWSLSKVIRIENGDVSISPNDLRLSGWQMPEFNGLGDPLQLPEHATALTGSVMDIPRTLRPSALPTPLGFLTYYAVFDESVFMRSTGGPVVFAAQLQELQQLAEKDLIYLRMRASDLDTPIANNAGSDRLFLGDGADGNQVLYRENGRTDELIEDKHSTSRHLATFAPVSDMATDESDTIGFANPAHYKLIWHMAIPLPDDRASHDYCGHPECGRL